MSAPRHSVQGGARTAAVGEASSGVTSVSDTVGIVYLPDPTAARGPSVQPRIGGHHLGVGTTLLRFEVIDPNILVKRSAANAGLFMDVLRHHGLPSEWEVLTLSCFAAAQDWPVERLAQGTGFGAYRAVSANRILDAGHELWPTDTYVDGVAAASNEVHYDLVVAAGPRLVPAGMNGPRAERKVAREPLWPAFEAVLGLFGPAQPL